MVVVDTSVVIILLGLVVSVTVADPLFVVVLGSASKEVEAA